MNARGGFAAIIVTIVVAALAVAAGYLYLRKPGAAAPQQASVHATSTASTTVSWTDRLHAVVDDLAPWQRSQLPEWRLTGTLTQEERAALPKGSVTELSQSFNANGFSSDADIDAARQKEDALINETKQTLAANGWTQTVAPHEGSDYQDYVYVKDGNAAVLETGTRAPVKGGMYVSLQFTEAR